MSKIVESARRHLDGDLEVKANITIINNNKNDHNLRS
jgi:hypothetical protein